MMKTSSMAGYPVKWAVYVPVDGMLANDEDSEKFNLGRA
jgi:hypothetical protein